MWVLITSQSRMAIKAVILDPDYLDFCPRWTYFLCESG
jgi:hypothetical protein